VGSAIGGSGGQKQSFEKKWLLWLFQYILRGISIKIILSW
jgi:hypothetical protein